MFYHLGRGAFQQAPLVIQGAQSISYRSGGGVHAEGLPLVAIKPEGVVEVGGFIKPDALREAGLIPLTEDLALSVHGALRVTAAFLDLLSREELSRHLRVKQIIIPSLLRVFDFLGKHGNPRSPSFNPHYIDFAFRLLAQTLNMEHDDQPVLPDGFYDPIARYLNERAYKGDMGDLEFHPDTLGENLGGVVAEALAALQREPTLEEKEAVLSRMAAMVAEVEPKDRN